MNAKKILVFAHVPPPYHGQSVMVQVLLDGLRADPRFEVYHVDARVSDDMEDLGSFRPKKFIRLFKCIWQAWWIRMRHGFGQCKEKLQSRGLRVERVMMR
jgi:hypothetical protein